MNDLLSKSLLIALFLSLNFPVFTQSTALSLYSYKDVVVVFPSFCNEDFINDYWQIIYIDTVSGIGIYLDGAMPFSPKFKFKNNAYHPNPIFLPLSCCNLSKDDSPFSTYTINFKTKAKAQKQYITLTTLSIAKVELWHEPPLLQKSYPLILKSKLGIELSEEEFIAIVNIQYSSKCGRANIEGRSTQVNIYKLVSEIDLKSLIEWAEFLSKNVEFYPIICSDFQINSLNYHPCESTH